MTTWDRITVRAGWAVLLLFTALSSYLNARRVAFDGDPTPELIVFHAAIPVVVLIAGMFAELVALSGVHRTAKWATVTILVGIFAVTLIASYVAVLTVVQVWNPHTPVWVNQALSAVPDAAMVMGGTVVLSLRVKRHGVAPRTSPTRCVGRLRRLADAATNRAEAALAAPVDPQPEHVSEGFAMVMATATEVSAKASPKGSPKKSTSVGGPSPTPVVDPSLAPYMETAEALEEARLVRGKAAADYAKILRATSDGWSPTRIRASLGYSHSTTEKVVAAATDRPALTAV